MIEQYIIITFCLLVIAVIAFVVYNKFTTKETCPCCNSEKDLQRIRKSEIVKHIPFTNMKHMVCFKCNKTHYQVEFKSYSIFVNNRIL